MTIIDNARERKGLKNINVHDDVYIFLYHLIIKLNSDRTVFVNYF